METRKVEAMTTGIVAGVVVVAIITTDIRIILRHHDAVVMEEEAPKIPTTTTIEDPITMTMEECHHHHSHIGVEEDEAGAEDEVAVDTIPTIINENEREMTMAAGGDERTYDSTEQEKYMYTLLKSKLDAPTSSVLLLCCRTLCFTFVQPFLGHVA